MKVVNNRVGERSKFTTLLKKLHDYAYVESLIIILIYLTAGYVIDPDDICLINGEVSYILILLAVVTLFHGFESGMLTTGVLALALWYFYPSFEYVEFLVALMMTLIFSEFHYYWTKKIKLAKLDADYRGTKLDELSKSFYSLKISHDQLEKNYVIKPMSIRNSIEQIVDNNKEIDEDRNILDKSKRYHSGFLHLLEKSFNVHGAIIIYEKEGVEDKIFSENTTNIVMGGGVEDISKEECFKDYLADKAINRKKPIFISDKDGEPAHKEDKNSNYIAAIPALEQNRVVGVLLIEKMSFMDFNRENLTSLSILLEYFFAEVRKKNVLYYLDEISIIEDQNFRFEYTRLKYLDDQYGVSSIVLVLRIDNELQATRIYEKIIKMLRSLDMVTLVKNNNLYYIVLLFPLHDNAAAMGFLNRLVRTLDEEKDKKFNYMTFDFSKTKLFNKYITEDYSNE